MFQTATIWNICQNTHRRYRFTGEAEWFACWLRLKREQPKKQEAAMQLAASITLKVLSTISYQLLYCSTAICQQQ